MGNKAGYDALICELIGTELARWIGLTTPDFAILHVPEFEHLDPIIQGESGPAFCSKWNDEAITLSPNTRLVAKIRQKDDIAKLVVFDTWVRNSDRFPTEGNHNNSTSNLDNLLLSPDKRMVQMIVIDHTHIFVEGTLDDDLGNDELIEEKTVFGLFDQFRPHLNHTNVTKSLEKLASIDSDTIWEILGTVPIEWDMTNRTKENLADFLLQRAEKLPSWLATELFGQSEMNFNVTKGE